jgi:uroporphyrinogen decarboxylase
MNSKERVLAAIRHTEPDRVPLGIWLYQPGFGSERLKADIEARYGSLDAFYAAFSIDLRMEIVPLPYRDYVPGQGGTMTTGAGGLPPEEITRDAFRDPDDEALYAGLRELITRQGDEKAIVAHVWGAVEGAYSFMGVEATLLNIAAQPQRMAALFEMIGEWSARVAGNVLDLGADIVQISADAGSTTGLLFSPRQWRKLVYPNDKLIADAIQRRGKPVVMHSDGHIWPIMDGIVEMGIDVLHPMQISAGMNPVEVKRKYGNRLTINGGLDLSYVLPAAPEVELVEAVRRTMEALKPGGGFIFNSEHFIPETVTLHRLELAYQTALSCARY